MIRTYLVEIPTTAKPGTTDAELIRALRHRFPEARIFVDGHQLGGDKVTSETPGQTVDTE